MFASKRVQKYSGILMRLAKLDSSIFNKLKVTVCEGEFIEENKFFLIAPLTQFDSVKDFENKNLSKEITEKAIENSTEQSEISNENKIVSFDDYPDSSDFSDDE